MNIKLGIFLVTCVRARLLRLDTITLISKDGEPFMDLSAWIPILLEALRTQTLQSETFHDFALILLWPEYKYICQIYLLSIAALKN